MQMPEAELMQFSNLMQNVGTQAYGMLRQARVKTREGGPKRQTNLRKSRQESKVQWSGNKVKNTQVWQRETGNQDMKHTAT